MMEKSTQRKKKAEVITIVHHIISERSFKQCIGLPEYWNELSRFEFFYTNNLLWLIVFVAMLILAQRWGVKKAFSFCILMAAILLATTGTERYLASWSGATADSLDMITSIVRLISLGIIAFVVMFYSIK
jgi:hypothetical protein